MIHATRRRLGALFTGGLALGAGLAPRPARAQAWPSKPITYVVPFPPGGTSDLTARLIGQEISKGLGQPVVVENRAGANGNIGSAAVAKAPPDGYTLLLGNIGVATSAALYRRLPYDPATAFETIGLVTPVPMVLVGRADLSAQDLPGLVAWMKERGAGVNLAHAGVGSASHLCATLLRAGRRLLWWLLLGSLWRRRLLPLRRVADVARCR